MQIFLLIRRLHRNLSTILQSVVAAPNDVSGVAHEASSVFCGISSEPNPFESEDNADEGSQALDLDSNGAGTDSRSSQSAHQD